MPKKQKWENNQKGYHWQNTPRQKQGKELLSELPKLAKMILAFRSLRQEDLDTVEHILCECVSISHAG